MLLHVQELARLLQERGEPVLATSVSVESVDSEYWCLNNAIVYAFIMRLTVEERVLRSTFKLNTLCNVTLWRVRATTVVVEKQ